MTGLSNILVLAAAYLVVYFQVSFNTLEKGKSYEVIAKLPVSPNESERGVITMETDSPTTPTLTIPVTVNVLRR